MFDSNHKITSTHPYDRQTKEVDIYVHTCIHVYNAKTCTSCWGWAGQGDWYTHLACGPVSTGPCALWIFLHALLQWASRMKFDGQIVQDEEEPVCTMGFYFGFKKSKNCPLLFFFFIFFIFFVHFSANNEEEQNTNIKQKKTQVESRGSWYHVYLVKSINSICRSKDNKSRHCVEPIHLQYNRTKHPS